MSVSVDTSDATAPQDLSRDDSLQDFESRELEFDEVGTRVWASVSVDRACARLAGQPCATARVALGG